ncbi:mucin-2 [Uranotaenia lowii]|uniref:mucin-2 n=1 Tax=Uranotaenia lowii TaxID=190385 RepID=UPI002479F4A2|nr:mucin-2 [Uranotaenia lowii]
MWPMKLDLTRQECRGVLRRLELECYASVMSTFRAQGSLCKEKSRILEDLRKVMHISQDRHKAEARRVANDEQLNTVAELLNGPNTYQDWCREGRRTFPILPRTTPYTALSYISNAVSEQIARINNKLPHPWETSQNRLAKEEADEEEQKKKQQEEEHKKLQEEQEEQQNASKKVEEEEPIAGPSKPPVVKEHVPAPVVTVDPFVEIANKSYINNDLKRSYPVQTYENYAPLSVMEDESPSRKKPQLYQELQKQEPLTPPPPIVTFHHAQPYQPQHIPMLQDTAPLSPHTALASPTNNQFMMTPINNTSNSSLNSTKSGRSKNTERPRKTSVAKQKNPNQPKPEKRSYQTKAKKAAAQQQLQLQLQQQLQQQFQQQLQQQQQQSPQQLQQQPFHLQQLGAVTNPMPIGPVKGSGKGVGSPHLIHSYASPGLPSDANPQAQNVPIEAINEPPQLQKHLTSNIIYQPQPQPAIPPGQPYGIPPGIPAKTQPLQSTGYNNQQPLPLVQNTTPNQTYGQHQILPSSKKDIQYNLTKLNPASNVPIKNNVNIPLRQSGSPYIPGKNHPLLNYQKKSPSKNLLIPTSSAAATLASLGIPKSIPRKTEPIINPADIPNPKIIFSSTPQQCNNPTAQTAMTPGNQITILDQITIHPPNKIIPSPVPIGTQSTPQASNFAPNQPNISAHSTPISGVNIPASVSAIPKTPISTAPITPVVPANKLVTIKGPNLAGFTPVKGGNKLSVHKLQLMPIAPPTGGKNSVFVLPAKGSTPSGTLNPGQKITIPKSSVISTIDPATLSITPTKAMSPPKVIVQQQPDLNNIVVLDIGADQKLKATSGVLGTQPKSVITEDTPVDIVSTPLDVVSGAVKLQELSKGFLSPSASGSSASPLTEKMVKTQPTSAPKYNSNSNVSKATKFEADSTAPSLPSAVTKKSKNNSLDRTAPTPAVAPQNNKVKIKPTTAAASSTTPIGSEPPVTKTTVMSSSTDWELELDQATRASNVKPNPNPKTPAAKGTSVTISSKPVLSTSSSGTSRKPPPLSSSSISSTSSSNASPPIVVEQPRASPQSHSKPIVTLAPPIPTPSPTVSSKPVSGAVTTTPPNERSAASDDTSATESADAEEDPEVGDEDEDEDPIEEDIIIDDEQHFNAVIEEDHDPEEDVVVMEEDDDDVLHGERVEIVNVGYDNTRAALIADLEGGEISTGAAAPAGTTVVVQGNGVTINPISMNFEQYIEEAEANGAADAEDIVIESAPLDSRLIEVNSNAASAGVNKNAMFQIVEIDAEGNKHTRTVSYEEALAEGQITVDGMLRSEVGGNSVGGIGASSSKVGMVKGKTKTGS